MYPATATIIAAGIGAVGSGLTGYGQAQQAKQNQKLTAAQLAAQQGLNYQQLGQSDRQFGQTSNLNRANALDQRAVGAADLQRRLNLAPLSDQASYFLQQRAGMPPSAFQPRDFTRGTRPGAGAPTGGVTAGMNQAAQAMQGYRAGMGGIDTSALRGAIGRLQDESQLPGEYKAQSADQMRLGAEMQQRMVDAANAKKAGDRLNLQGQMNSLQQSMGGGIGNAPNVLRAGDAEQAERDAEKAAAKKRLMTMLGLGAAAALPGAIGAVAPILKTAQTINKANNALRSVGAASTLWGG